MSKNGIFTRHKFIDDYIVIDELDGSSGKKVKKVYYNAEYYETDWSDEKCRSFKRITLLLSALCTAGSMFPLSVRFDGMKTAYVSMAYVFSVILSVMMFISATELPKNSEPMQRAAKTLGFDKLRTRSLIVCFLGIYGALMNTAFTFIIFPKYAGTERLFTGTDILVSVCSAVVAVASYYCLTRLKTANVHHSQKENEWQRLKHELEERGEQTAADED